MRYFKNSIYVYDEQGRRCLIEWRHGDAEDLLKFMHLVLTTEASFFKSTTNNHQALGRAISMLGMHYKKITQYAKSRNPGWKHSPLLRLFYTQYRLHAIRKFPLFSYADGRGDLTPLAHVFDDFISALRQRAKRLKLMAKVRNWDSKTKKLKERIKALGDYIFSKNSDIYVFELNLYPRSARLSVEEIQSLSGEQPSGIGRKKSPAKNPDNFLSMQKDLTHFLSRMRDKPSIFRNLVNYVQRMAFNPYMGYSAHFFFFFTSSTPNLADQIGGYWEEVSEERGTYAILNVSSLNRARLSSSGNSLAGISELSNGLLDKVMPPEFWSLHFAMQKIPSPGARMFSTGRIPSPKV